MGKIKHTIKPRSLIRSLKSLLGINKGVNPHTRYPDDYYGRISFDKSMFQGIERITRIERLSKKKAARLLIEKGFSGYMGEKIKESEG